MSSYMNRLPTSWVFPSPKPKLEATEKPSKAGKPITRRSKSATAPKADKAAKSGKKPT